MLFNVNTHPTSLHRSIQIIIAKKKKKKNVSDNMRNWFNFDT